MRQTSLKNEVSLIRWYCVYYYVYVQYVMLNVWKPLIMHLILITDWQGRLQERWRNIYQLLLPLARQADHGHLLRRPRHSSRERSQVRSRFHTRRGPWGNAWPHRAVQVSLRWLQAHTLSEAGIRCRRHVPLSHYPIYLPRHLEGVPKAEAVHRFEGAVRIPMPRNLRLARHSCECNRKRPASQ